MREHWHPNGIMEWGWQRVMAQMPMHKLLISAVLESDVTSHPEPLRCSRTVLERRGHGHAADRLDWPLA